MRFSSLLYLTLIFSLFGVLVYYVQGLTPETEHIVEILGNDQFAK